mmetsp:Transcript_4676/g.12217  ORF Transcript_4676/g.12217 Transcript_4676/m.12217 type:complete len:103 (-) Transcript_4676:81-389(-)
MSKEAGGDAPNEPGRCNASAIANTSAKQDHETSHLTTYLPNARMQIDLVCRNVGAPMSNNVRTHPVILRRWSIGLAPVAILRVVSSSTTATRTPPSHNNYAQ